jgi:hypothetical protein
MAWFWTGMVPLCRGRENGMEWGTYGRGRPPGGLLQHGNFVALKGMKTASRTGKTGRKLQECQESRSADKKGLERGEIGECDVPSRLWRRTGARGGWGVLFLRGGDLARGARRIQGRSAKPCCPSANLRQNGGKIAKHWQKGKWGFAKGRQKEGELPKVGKRERAEKKATPHPGLIRNNPTSLVSSVIPAGVTEAFSSSSEPTGGNIPQSAAQCNTFFGA